MVFKGDTATNATKPAKLETGAEIKVPLFIEEGDHIKVDTRTGEYITIPSPHSTTFSQPALTKTPRGQAGCFPKIQAEQLIYRNRNDRPRGAGN